jgi:hypothetical protein
MSQLGRSCPSVARWQGVTRRGDELTLLRRLLVVVAQRGERTRGLMAMPTAELPAVAMWYDERGPAATFAPIRRAPPKTP